MKAPDKTVLTGHHTPGQVQNFITACIRMSFTQDMTVAVDTQKYDQIDLL